MGDALVCGCFVTEGMPRPSYFVHNFDKRPPWGLPRALLGLRGKKGLRATQTLLSHCFVYMLYFRGRVLGSRERGGGTYCQLIVH